MNQSKDPVQLVAELEGKLIACELMWNLLVGAAPPEARARAAVQADIALEAAPDVPVAHARQSFAAQIEMLRAQLTAGLR